MEAIVLAVAGDIIPRNEALEFFGSLERYNELGGVKWPFGMPITMVSPSFGASSFVLIIILLFSTLP